MVPDSQRSRRPESQNFDSFRVRLGLPTSGKKTHYFIRYEEVKYIDYFDCIGQQNKEAH